MVGGLSGSELVFEFPNGTRALDGVDVEILPGELVCVLGPNGSGKSTLQKLFGGVLQPASGQVTLEGRPLKQLKPTERARRIAAVPQVLAALPDADVNGFVLGGRYPHQRAFGRRLSDDRAAVRRALSEVDAAGWGERRVPSLSGGQAQRVLVARALAQEADFLLFDEPTTALDPEHQVRSFELFRRLVDGGRAALIATHELHLAGCFADRILLMQEGRICAAGTPAEVLLPEVLEPVFGAQLYFGGAPQAGGQGTRPLVVPWPRGEGPR